MVEVIDSFTSMNLVLPDLFATRGKLSLQMASDAGAGSLADSGADASAPKSTGIMSLQDAWGGHSVEAHHSRHALIPG